MFFMAQRCLHEPRRTTTALSICRRTFFMTFDLPRTVAGTFRQRRKGSYFSNNAGLLKFLSAFLFGILIGRIGQSKNSTGKKFSDASEAVTVKSSIQHLRDIPVRETSHIDKNTRNAITKQQFLEPFLVPNVAGFSVATIRRNQTVEMHSHRSMHEFFYVLEGSATFFMNDDNDQQRGYRVDPGTFVHFVPNCAHGIVVAGDSTEGDLKVLLAGVTVGD